MACCFGSSSKYQPETASDYVLVTVTVPEGYTPGQTMEVIAPDLNFNALGARSASATGVNRNTTTRSPRVVIATIPPECDYAGSTFMVRFPKTGAGDNATLNNNNNTARASNRQNTAPPQKGTIVSPQEELKICVRAPGGASVGTMMYAGVPGDSSRVLPIRVPSKKIKTFYVDYTMEQTILRSDIPGAEGGGKGNKQNWHDNRLAVMAPLFF
jgi:hypothetical protein